MPAFRQFQPRELRALSTYLKTPLDRTKPPGPTATASARYTIDGYPLFLDQHGVPAISPPWGTLNAIDLLSGDLLWRVPLGEYPQLVAKGIRVNCIAPGPVWTPLNPSDKEAEDVSKFGSQVPMKRPAQPEEIAPAYVFLASPQMSSYITGEILPIIGGYGH